jgi:hypothetical protein
MKREKSKKIVLEFFWLHSLVSYVSPDNDVYSNAWPDLSAMSYTVKSQSLKSSQQPCSIGVWIPHSHIIKVKCIMYW